MKRSLLVVFVLLAINCFAQTKNAYWFLTGTIDKYAITMHLHKDDHTYEGYYYYNSIQHPVYFTGEDTSKQNEITLTTLTGADKTEYFNLIKNDKKIEGTWKQDSSIKILNVSLSETEMPLHFIYETVHDEMPLRKNLKESPAAAFDASSVWPKGNTTTDLFLASFIRKVFGDSSSNENIIAVLKKNRKLFFDDYIDMNKDVTNDDLGASLNYNETDNLLISYQSFKLLSLAYETYVFSGGAHGNYGTIYSSFDIVQNKKLELSDILNAAGIKKLQLLLEKNFRQQYDLSASAPLTDAGLFNNSIKPNNNFYVTGKGIQFAYTPYEIGPYVMGEIEIYISFADLKSYLQPGFINLIN